MFTKFFKEYFSFSKYERNAIVILVLIIAALTTYYFIAPYAVMKSQTDFSKFENEIQKLDKIIKENDSIKVEQRVDNEKSYSMKSFDPNTVSYQELIEMGFEEKLAKTIINYRSKVGEFKSPDDLTKVYGMTNDFFDRIYNYINIKNTDKENHFSEIAIAPEFITYDINIATAKDLETLKGIGKVYSERIINYRNSLGGFVKVDQLLEVYGIDSLIFMQIKNHFITSNIPVKKISINSSSYKDLVSHPYINKELASSIIKYISTNGPLKSLDELYDEGMIKDLSEFKSLLPYLKLWPD